MRHTILTLADLADIFVLENKSQPFPWSAAKLESSLKRSDAVCLGVHKGHKGVDPAVKPRDDRSPEVRHPAVQPRGPERLMGYILGGSVLNEAEIWNFAVLPHFRKQGIGTFLLAQLIYFFEKRGIKAIYLEVRCSNQAAIRLYQKVGFREISQRKNYYETKMGREDALFMCCNK